MENTNVPVISAKDLNLWYGDFKALKGISLDVGEREITALIGPSGCGKSTFLKTLNRMNDLVPNVRIEGDVRLKGEDIFAREMQLTDLRRRVGMVFQKANPFPMSIYDNITYGPKLHGVRNKAELDELVESSLRGAALWDEVKDRLKKSALGMSGGQQQRLCIARALAVQPEVLLMDEPLSNLDAKLRVEMRSVIRHTQKSVGITTVYVTHDQEEAMAISDRIAVMKDGVIQHVGTPRDIYQRPKNVFVATFIGRTNIVNAHVKDGIITFADGYHEHIDALDKAAEQDVRCSIRPEEFIICKDGTDGIHGTVQECTYLGLNTHYTIDTDQGDSVEIVEESSIGEGLKKGEKVLLKVKKEKINVFTKDGGTNLIRSDAYEKQ